MKIYTINKRETCVECFRHFQYFPRIFNLCLLSDWLASTKSVWIIGINLWHYCIHSDSSFTDILTFAGDTCRRTAKLVVWFARQETDSSPSFIFVTPLVENDLKYKQIFALLLYTLEILQTDCWWHYDQNNCYQLSYAGKKANKTSTSVQRDVL